MTIREQIKQLASKRRTKIAIGILHPEKEVINSLQKAEKYADLIIIGCKVKGFKCISTKEVESNLVTLLKDKKVDGIVRGQGDAISLRECIKKLFNYTGNDPHLEITLIFNKNYEFIIAPATNGTGWIKEEKIALIEASIKLLNQFKIKPKVGLLTGVRPGSLGINKMLDATYYQVENIIRYFKKKGIKAINYSIELEKTVSDGVNIIVPSNGMVGNQVNRTLLFFANFELLGSMDANIKENVCETLRNQKSFYWGILFAAARANRG